MLSIGFVGAEPLATPHLSVDGMTVSGPNLSHWPGNRTPARYKADLSTGICLAFARAPAEERAAFLAGARMVVNDHFDTDGFLSMLAVTRPDVALPRAALCLEAAATGDYQAYQGEAGFAVDRIVLGLLRHPRSPLAAELPAMSPPHRALRGYRWLLENATLVLDQPQELAFLWRDEHARITAELAAARAGALRRQEFGSAGLAVLTSEGDVARMVLNTCAGAFRVLHVQGGEGGPRYRYHDRTESWFEVVTFRPPPRRDLRPLAARLEHLERRATSAPTGQWCADPPDDPVPELYFGAPAAQEYGEITRTLTPSALAPGLVAEVLAAGLDIP